MNEMNLFPITLLIIAITVVVSLIAFNNHDLRNKFLFYPYGMRTPSQYYRFLSHGLIHADYIHLFFNMFTFYSFGRLVEVAIMNKYEYIIFYVSALIASSVFDFIKNKDNSSYAALGASGAVSAVLFSTVILAPWQADIAIFGVLRIPSIVYAVIYLVYCGYMDKRGRDNIGHSAHFWGSIYGFVFTALIRPDLLSSFISQLLHPPFLH